MMKKTSSLFGLILLISFIVCCSAGDTTTAAGSATLLVQKQQHDNGTTDTRLRRAALTAKQEGEQLEITKDPKRGRDHEKKKLRQQRKLSDHYYDSDGSGGGGGSRQQDYTLAVRGTMQLEFFGGGSDNDRRQLRQRQPSDQDQRRRLDGHLVTEITNADINAWLDATEDFYFDSMFDFRVTRGRVVNFQMGYLDSEWSTETQCFLVTFRAVIRARGGSGLRVRQVARAMAQADYVTYITDYLWEENDGNTPWFETQRVEYDGQPVIKGFDF